MTMWAILYVRVSTPRQAEEGYGADYQGRELRRWAEAEGYEVLEVVVEPGYSRESWDRPGLDRIRELAGSGFSGDVLAWKRDRYFADPVYRGLFDKEMENYGIRLRAMNDAGGDTPTDEFTDGIIDLIARLEVRNTTERTRAGKRERAHKGKYVWTGSVPYGYRYEDGGLVPDPATEGNVRRVFQIVGEQGRGMNQVCKAFMAEGVPSPRGSKTWGVSTVGRIIRNDVYLSRPYEEVAALVSPEVAARLDRNECYAVTHYNQRRTKTTHTMGGKTRNVTFNDEDQWIPVPVPALDVPPEWVLAARRNVEGRSPWQPNRQREWPLRGIAFCPCGRQLIAYYNVRKGYKNVYMVCPRKRRLNDCPHARYHRAAPLEERVAGFVLGLVRNPEVLREQVEAGAERLTRGQGDSERRMRDLQSVLTGADQERERYTRLYARGKLTDAEYDRYTDELDRRKETARGELVRLQNARQHVEDLRVLVDDYLEDLAHLTDRLPTVREYGTVPEPRTEDNPLGAYTLTPERIRHLSDEELGQKRREAEDARAARYRALYDRLGIRAVAHEDGTVELTWAGGCTELRPSGRWTR